MLEGIRSVKKPYILTLMAIDLGCSILPAVPSGYMMRVSNMTLITYLYVLSVYVSLELYEQSSFAQAGPWDIGAYITANMVLKLGLGSATAFIIAITDTAASTSILGFALSRLKQYYLIFASVGLMMIPNGLFMDWVPVTGDALGISDIPVFSVAGFTANTKNRKFSLILIVCILVSLGIKILFHSPLGRSFMAIRDNEMAANYLGISSLLTKNTAFAISGALCGAAGAMYVLLSEYSSYQIFTYQQSTMYSIMIMLGDTMSPAGVIIGTLIISLLQEWVRPLQNYMQFIHGTGIMILMIVQPEGIIGGGKEFHARYIEGGTGRFTIR